MYGLNTFLDGAMYLTMRIRDAYVHDIYKFSMRFTNEFRSLIHSS